MDYSLRIASNRRANGGVGSEGLLGVERSDTSPPAACVSAAAGWTSLLAFAADTAVSMSAPSRINRIAVFRDPSSAIFRCKNCLRSCGPDARHNYASL